MSDKHQMITPITPTAPLDAKAVNVLLVSPDQEALEMITHCLVSRHLQVKQVDNIETAKQHLAKHQTDVAVIGHQQTDGQGLALIDHIAQNHQRTVTMMITQTDDYDLVVQAVRAGAVDVISLPRDAEIFNDRLINASKRFLDKDDQLQRVQKLKRICRKLNRGRKDIKQQVDILCKDLVAAYQELAVQMNQMVQTSEYAGLIRQELDLEELLRKTLEFILQKAGPTNAAIFLPASSDEFSLGGYVNYDRCADSGELLLQHLADVVAPRISEHDQLIHITDKHAMAAWVDEYSTYLTDNHMIAFCCPSDDETLAVVMLFRDDSEPFEEGLLEILESISPLIGDYLARLIRIHHRAIEPEDDEQDGQGDGDIPWGFAA